MIAEPKLRLTMLIDECAEDTYISDLEDIFFARAAALGVPETVEAQLAARVAANIMTLLCILEGRTIYRDTFELPRYPSDLADLDNLIAATEELRDLEKALGPVAGDDLAAVIRLSVAAVREFLQAVRAGYSDARERGER